MKVVGLDYQPEPVHGEAGRARAVVDRCAARPQAAAAFWWRRGLASRSFSPTPARRSSAFTPDRPGEFAFNCGMGMMTPGSKITVLPRDKG